MKFTVPIDPPENWHELRPHPLADIIKMGSGIDQDGLSDHMKANGYDEDEAVILMAVNGHYEILDGRHRTPAAVRAGVVPTFKLFTGPDAEAYVRKKAFRQHLNTSQRALLAAKIIKHSKKAQNGAPKRAQNGAPEDEAQNGATTDGTAASLNVGSRTVEKAKLVIEGCSKKVIKAVEEGVITVDDAAKIAGIQPRVQAKALQAVLDRVVSTVAAYCFPLCERCKEVKIDNCTACTALHQRIAENKKVTIEPEGYFDDAGAPVPEKLWPVFKAVRAFKLAERKLTECAKIFKLIEDSPAKEKKPIDPAHKHFEKFFTVFKNARWRTRNMRPAMLCTCQGAGCPLCQEFGWLTVEEAEHMFGKEPIAP